jgi:hypothetical protein
MQELAPLNALLITDWALSGVDLFFAWEKELLKLRRALAPGNQARC